MSVYKIVIGKDMAPHNKNTSQIMNFIREALPENKKGSIFDLHQNLTLSFLCPFFRRSLDLLIISQKIIK